MLRNDLILPLTITTDYMNYFETKRRFKGSRFNEEKKSRYTFYKRLFFLGPEAFAHENFSHTSMNEVLFCWRWQFCSLGWPEQLFARDLLVIFLPDSFQLLYRDYSSFFSCSFMGSHKCQSYSYFFRIISAGIIVTSFV